MKFILLGHLSTWIPTEARPRPIFGGVWDGAATVQAARFAGKRDPVNNDACAGDVTEHPSRRLERGPEPAPDFCYRLSRRARAAIRCRLGFLTDRPQRTARQ